MMRSGLNVWTAGEQAAADVAEASLWLAGLLPQLRQAVAGTGAALLRGLPVHSAADVALLRDQLIAHPMRTVEHFAHREQPVPGIYSMVRWPADRMLCPHQEQSYALEFPGLLLMACVKPAAAGGEVLLCDAGTLADRLPAPLVQRLRAQGWQMTRTFRDYFGMSWREAFGVPDLVELQGFFRAHQIDADWLPDGTLQLTRLRPAMIHHPVSGQLCWFNQVGFLNEGSMEPVERAMLQQAFGVQMPVNTAFGDGSALTDADLRALEDAYDSTAIEHVWQPGDLLLVDNIRIACGRLAQQGESEVLVAMGDPVRLKECGPQDVTNSGAEHYRVWNLLSEGADE